MAKLSKFGENFLLVALRINKHIHGYVDFYYGPKNLKKLVENEAMTSPHNLLIDLKTLQKDLLIEGFDKNREKYLEKLLLAMKTSIEDLLGIEIPFKEKFLRLYDVELQPINESEIYNLINDFNEAYKGSGSLNERMNVLRERRTVPKDKVYLLFNKAINIVAMKTKELFGDILPIEEKIQIDLVDNINDNEAKWAFDLIN